jgi:hypothetical protein
MDRGQGTTASFNKGRTARLDFSLAVQPLKLAEKIKNKKISTFVSCYSHINKKFNEIK